MKLQLARTIFLNALEVMKKNLDLVAFKFSKNSEDFRYFKKEIMDYTYNGLKKTFKQLEEQKIIIKCECGASLRNGWKSCESCGGSGFTNSEK